MNYHIDDTIVAIASAPRGAARGIVRLSGPQVVETVAPLFVSESNSPLDRLSRATALVGDFLLPTADRRLPGMLYVWPSGRRYTGQPAAEIHTLGSPPLLAIVMSELCRRGARSASAGEFTLRAFLAGRIDLTQAEAVLGIIDARGPDELALALDQLAGGLARPLAQARERLWDLLARLEAGLDFVDEDIEFIGSAEITAELQQVEQQIATLRAQFEARRSPAEQIRVVLVGRPNAGKSSLFNALVDARALVSSQPGTTRDYLTATLRLGEVTCELVDTAGVELGNVENLAAGPLDINIAAQAQAQTARQADQADIVMFCIPAGQKLTTIELDRITMLDRKRSILAITKCDLGEATALSPPAASKAEITRVMTSAHRGEGLESLRQAIAERVVSLRSRESRSVAATAVRAQDDLRQTSQAIERALGLVSTRAGEELVAAEIRLAIDALGRISGVVADDDLLDRIFSRFCIGK